MTRTLRLLAVFFSLGLFTAAGAVAQAGEEPVAPGEEKPLLSRIDFGNAYVMGQSIKSGAVYLLNRKKSDIRSMLEERKDFRKEIREDAEVVDRSVE